MEDLHVDRDGVDEDEVEVYVWNHRLQSYVLYPEEIDVAEAVDAHHDAGRVNDLASHADGTHSLNDSLVAHFPPDHVGRVPHPTLDHLPTIHQNPPPLPSPSQPNTRVNSLLPIIVEEAETRAGRGYGGDRHVDSPRTSSVRMLELQVCVVQALMITFPGAFVAFNDIRLVVRFATRIAAVELGLGSGLVGFGFDDDVGIGTGEQHG